MNSFCLQLYIMYSVHMPKQTMQILFDLDCSFIVLQWNQSKQYVNKCLQTNKI